MAMLPLHPHVHTYVGRVALDLDRSIEDAHSAITASFPMPRKVSTIQRCGFRNILKAGHLHEQYYTRTMTSTMNVSFDSVDPLNSAVVDDATGQVLFQVSTPRWKLGNSTTTIKDQNEQVVAEYEPRFGHDMVTVHGRTTQKSEWLPRKSRWSS